MKNRIRKINQNDKIKFFDINIYELLIDELNNVPEIIRDINISSTEKNERIRRIFSTWAINSNYFFFLKSYAVAHNFKGIELIKLYELVVQSINLKIAISELKDNFWDDKNAYNYEDNFETDLFSIHMINKRKDFLITIL